mmetsp:Transcript_105542/g.293877  ORF Transcript_105542/g.293877 Transcript_105542/m.293877 type:complete len:273 (+) Transcript_105542:107-925(+)
MPAAGSAEEAEAREESEACEEAGAAGASPRRKPLLVPRAQVLAREGRDDELLEGWGPESSGSTSPARSQDYSSRNDCGTRSLGEALDELFLGVQFLMSREESWVLDNRPLPDNFEASLSTFLQREVPQRAASLPTWRDLEVLLRGLVRNLQDIDRLLRSMNPSSELRRIEHKPLALSMLRVVMYELLWTPRSAAWLAELARCLAERCIPRCTPADAEWIAQAAVRMHGQLLQRQQEWEAKVQAQRARRFRPELGLAHGLEEALGRSPKRGRR